MTGFRHAWLLALGAILTVAPARAQSSCRPPDAPSERIARHLARDVAGTDPHSAERRAARALPGGANVPVQVVTDDRICAAALVPYEAKTRFFDRTTQQWGPAPQQVYVVQVGVVFVVWAPERSVGEFGQFVTLDSAFRVLAAVLN